MAWRPADRFTVSAEYFYGKFDRGLAQDDEVGLSDRHLVAFQLGVLF
jgi:hypothetical protein